MAYTGSIHVEKTQKQEKNRRKGEEETCQVIEYSTEYRREIVDTVSKDSKPSFPTARAARRSRSRSYLGKRGSADIC